MPDAPVQEHPLLHRLELGQVILGDGAMGTQLYERGIYINRNFDALNLTDPHLVKSVHREYVQAGARFLETNTFGANPVKLGKAGLSEQTEEINRNGAEIAHRCAEEGANVMVAGSIGPLGNALVPIGTITRKQALLAYKRQVRGLVDGGVDFFILETFLDLSMLLIALEAVRSLSDLPVVALMTINQDAATSYGQSPEQIAQELEQAPAEILGLNCSTGPHDILENLKRMRPHTTKPLAAFPNAGEPRVVEGRVIYMATPEYFAEYAKRMVHNGVRIIGGCCGTNAMHIRAMASAVRALKSSSGDVATSPGEAEPAVEVAIPAPEEAEGKPIPPRAERSPLARLLDDGKFPVSTELHPPRSSMTGLIIRQVLMLKRAGIDAVNIPDGPRASARMSPMVLAHIIRTQTDMDVILHYTCRDRNILGIQSDLLGAEALGMNNLLAVTGDPPKLGDYPMATAVYDVDSIGLLKIAHNLNRSLDIIGKPLSKGTSFFLGAGFNPGAIDIRLELDRLEKKIESGAEYILTQPVFDHEKLLAALKHRALFENIPVFVGILPLVSYRNAEFFHNEVPGMDVPKHIRERMQKASDKSKDYAMRTGIEIAQETLSSAAPHVRGAYIMPPFGKVEMAIETASVLKGRPRLEEIMEDEDSD